MTCRTARRSGTHSDEGFLALDRQLYVRSLLVPLLLGRMLNAMSKLEHDLMMMMNDTRTREVDKVQGGAIT